MRIKTKTRHSCTNIYKANLMIKCCTTGLVYAESAITYVATESGREMKSSHLAMVSWSTVERKYINTSFIKIKYIYLRTFLTMLEKILVAIMSRDLTYNMTHEHSHMNIHT